MRCDNCREGLDAYIDDELPADERREIDAHLSDCARCGDDHTTLMDTRRLLRKHMVRYQAPDVLRARVRAAVLQLGTDTAPARRASRWSWPSWVAAGLLIAATSSALTATLLHRRDTSDVVAGEVVASHIRSLMPGHLTDVVSTDQHNVKPWFNGRVDLSPAVPDLSAQGFPLQGGRLDYVHGRAVPVVVYGRRQHVINVYEWPATESDRDWHATRNGYHLIAWTRDGRTHWAVSDLNDAELREFVRAFSDATAGK
ncbi:MAG TPA: anti-sigma factor [Vicinamibacterales bacterium]|nr:anti-sigma factor [Vicinamibacterales bacterium]